MRKITILAVAVAFILVAAGSYAILTSGGAFNNAKLPPVDNDGDDAGPDVPGNETLSIPFPMVLATGDARIVLDLDYPGKGQEGAYNYSWNQPYVFYLNSSVPSDYEGRVLTKIFAVKSGEIGPKCLIVTSGGGPAIAWELNEKDGINVISGDLGNWTSNGTGGSALSFDVTFNRTGDFNLTFQSFDLDTGEPLSAPMTVGPLRTPVRGALSIDAFGQGDYRTEENGTYYTVLINITNGWNIRYVADASYLVLSNGTSEVRANLSAMTFGNQSLATGQSTQFLAYFDITGDIDEFRLEYRDEASDQVIEVPLS